MSTDPIDPAKSSKRKPKGDYEVGYCRPPKSSRWQRGQPSPNPRGRRASEVEPSELVNQVARTMLPIVEGGTRTKITKHEAFLRKLFADALKGDRKAQAEVLKARLSYNRMQKADSNEDEPEVIWVFESSADSAAAEESPPEQQRPRRLSIKQRQQESRRETFDRIAARPISVRENGITRRMSCEEAIWHSLYADALKGDRKAQVLINRFIDRIGSSAIKQPPDDEEMIFTLSIGDKEVITGDEPNPQPTESDWND